MSSSETRLPARRASDSVLSRVARSPASCRARRSCSTTRTCSPASGTPSKPSTSTGSPGQRLRDPVAEEVVHRAHAAPVGAGDERVADLERAAADQDRHHRAAARVELGLDHRAGRGRVGVRAQLLDLGHRDDRLEQVVEALLGLGRDVDELGVAAPLDRLQAELRHLGAHAVGLRALLVDLVDRDEHRHARPPWRGRPPPGSAA